MRTRHLLCIFFATGLTLAAATPVVAQATAPKRLKQAAPAKRGEALSAAETTIEEQIRQAEEDPQLAERRDKFNAQMNREMYEMKESLVRDAVNKMHNRRNDQSRDRLVEDVAIFMAWMIVLSAVLWLIRTILEQRRWSRVASIQTDIHNKLLEKMASSQELLAYMETEAGKRFLESSPFEIEHKVSPSFPFGRILLSAQAGMVVLVVGVGLLWLQGQLPDSAQPLLIFGTLAMALGFGLLFSAGLAYSMSKHLGIMPGSTQGSAPQAPYQRDPQ